EHRNIMEEGKIKDCIIKRPYRNRPLTEQDKKHNRTYSGVRCTVERVFGVLKQHYGMGLKHVTWDLLVIILDLT
ncbi:transposase, partial [Thiotrichales bacterium HSG1]|nr:transposase [Thiotrichales bacterium HSG1]